MKGVEIGLGKTTCDEGRWMNLTPYSVKLWIFVRVPQPGNGKVNCSIICNKYSVIMWNT
jgi:hypothetical protein